MQCFTRGPGDKCPLSSGRRRRLYEVGKSALDNNESQDEATRSLTQAFNTQGKSVTTKQIQDWLETNKRFIANQYAAQEAIAAATRASNDWKATQNTMTEAEYLAIIMHDSLSEAMDQLVRAEHGRSRAPLDLGIEESDLEDPTKLAMLWLYPEGVLQAETGKIESAPP